ncbi:MAG TPA: transporter substrate-binding domain-containing protein [Clostridia bacterium]|nr:transporter substrate-binding domain-containing protein [Clostridia bacterium]
MPALGTGKIDFIAAGMTITDERKKNVDFSDPYYTAIQNMIVPENSTIKSAADLDGKRVGVVLGYTGDFAVTDMVDKEGKKITITRMNKGTDIILELLNGKIDAVVIDSPPAKEFVIKNKDLKIVEDNAVFSGEEYGIAVKKGNADLLAKINKVIKDLKASGKVDELVKTYSTK